MNEDKWNEIPQVPYSSWLTQQEHVGKECSNVFFVWIYFNVVHRCKPKS